MGYYHDGYGRERFLEPDAHSFHASSQPVSFPDETKDSKLRLALPRMCLVIGQVYPLKSVCASKKFKKLHAWD
jgi:hypothetical protein